MGVCYHIDSITCPVCRPENEAERVLSGFFRARDEALATIQRYQYKPRDRDQQDAAWRDLAGI